MKLENSHLMLVLAPDPQRAAAQVRRFFQRTQLVRYDELRLFEEECQNAVAAGFMPRLEEGLAANRRALDEVVAELQKAGIRSLAELARVPQGYQSKLAHTAVHLLDGFFGIDSAFYNLVEDSHWLSDQLRREIAQDPEDYYLLPLVGEMGFAGRQHLVGALRGFER